MSITLSATFSESSVTTEAQVNVTARSKLGLESSSQGHQIQAQPSSSAHSAGLGRFLSRKSPRLGPATKLLSIYSEFTTNLVFLGNWKDCLAVLRGKPPCTRSAKSVNSAKVISLEVLSNRKVTRVSGKSENWPRKVHDVIIQDLAQSEIHASKMFTASKVTCESKSKSTLPFDSSTIQVE